MKKLTIKEKVLLLLNSDSWTIDNLALICDTSRQVIINVLCELRKEENFVSYVNISKDLRFKHFKINSS